MTRVLDVKKLYLKVSDSDCDRLMKVCSKNDNLIEAISIRKHKALNEELKYYVLIEFFYEIPYEDIFSKFYSVLRESFEVLNICDKWGH